MYVMIYNDDDECVDIIDPKFAGPFPSEREEQDWVEEGTLQAISEAFSLRRNPPNKRLEPTPESGQTEQSEQTK